MAARKDNRSIQILIRVTPSEYKAIKKNTEKSGLSMSEFIRRSVLGETIVSAPPADFIVLIQEVKRIGNNVNQVSQKLKSQGQVHALELEKCSTEISDTVKMLYRTFRPGKENG